MAQFFLANAIFLGRGEWGGTFSSMVTASTTCIFGRLRMSSKMDDFRIFGCVHVAFKIPAFPRKNSQLAGILESCPDAITSSLCANESQSDGTNMVGKIREKG